jgi:hypothetical protein
MDVLTSVVSIPGLNDTELFMFAFSIGMVSISIRSMSSMVLPS